jgi:hypothetical protein
MIRVIAMKSGMNLIADVEVNDQGAILKKPAAVVMQNSPNGESMIGFSPYLIYTEEFNTGIAICYEDFIAVLTPEVEILNAYSKYFGSGIQVASSLAL